MEAFLLPRALLLCHGQVCQIKAIVERKIFANFNLISDRLLYLCRLLRLGLLASLFLQFFINLYHFRHDYVRLFEENRSALLALIWVFNCVLSR